MIVAEEDNLRGADGLSGRQGSLAVNAGAELNAGDEILVDDRVFAQGMAHALAHLFEFVFAEGLRGGDVDFHVAQLLVEQVGE